MPARTIKETLKPFAQWCVGACLLAATSVVCAQACRLPVPFQHEFQAYNVTASLSAANATDPCALSVAVNSGAGPTAAGFLHYRRATAIPTVRYGFRVNTSALTNFTVPLQNLQLFAASSPVVFVGLRNVSNLLQINLFGTSTNPMLRFSAAYSGGVLSADVPIAQTINTVRIEIKVGSGTNGSVRYWLNHAFSDPPDGVIDNGGAGLNNATWLGVIGAEIGLSSPSNSFRANHAGNAIVFDQVESTDDLLFWDDFSNGAQ
jgi:hypothetical protein